VQAVRRVLANLPASSQVLSPCPYLDPSLFQYNEKLMSAMMRPRPFSETPIRYMKLVKLLQLAKQLPLGLSNLHTGCFRRVCISYYL